MEQVKAVLQCGGSEAAKAARDSVSRMRANTVTLAQHGCHASMALQELQVATLAYVTCSRDVATLLRCALQSAERENGEHLCSLLQVEYRANAFTAAFSAAGELGWPARQPVCVWALA